MMEDPIFLSMEEARAQEEYYQKLEEEYWKYGHMVSMSDGWLESCVRASSDPRAVEIANNILKGRRKEKGGILQYMKSQIADPVIVPEKITKEMIESLLKDKFKRNHYYPPNTPEMEAIMLRMIDELPDGGYRIKTTRDESK